MGVVFDIQPGDVLYWQGFSKVIQGTVVQWGNGQLAVMTDEVHGLMLNDLIHSPSLRVERNGVPVTKHKGIVLENAPVLF